MREKGCRCPEASCKLPSGKYGAQTYNGERRTEPSAESVRKKLSGLAQQDLTAALFQDTIALPCAQHAAGSESSHVRGIRQFLVGDIEFDAARNVVPNNPDQTTQHTGQSLFS